MDMYRIFKTGFSVDDGFDPADRTGAGFASAGPP